MERGNGVARRQRVKKVRARRSGLARNRTRAEQLCALSDGLGTMLNSAGIGIARCTRDLRYLQANEAYGSIVGLPLDRIIGQSIVEVMGDAAFATIRPYIERVLMGARVEYECDIPYRHGVKGSFFRVVCVPDLDFDGSVVGWSACLSDITSSKHAERLIAERNTQLALASKTARVGSLAIDFHTGLVKLSPGCATILGLPESTIEISTDDANKRVLPEDLALLVLRRNQALLEQQREFVAQFRIRRADDGEVRWIEARSLLFYDQSGKPAQLIGVRIDFTDRKLAEDMLAERNLQLELAGKVGRVGNYAYDVSAETLQVSDGYSALHGLPEGTSETTLSEWRARVHPEDLGSVEGVHNQAVADKQREYSAEYRIVRSDGEVRWTERRCFISYDADGCAQRVVGVSIDITERKRAEEAQRTLNAELDHRVKNALATVSAVVSHTGQGSRSVANFVAAVEGRIRSMATTHDLLSARRWQGISMTDLARCELAPYITRHNAEISGPEVLLKPETGQAMAMVLHELATNAAKYGSLSTKNGRVSIRWRWRMNGQQRSSLVLEWQEIGGPPVVATVKTNYGTSTICDLIPYEFGGTVDHTLDLDGVRCRVELPAHWFSKDEAASEAIAHATGRTADG